MVSSKHKSNKDNPKFLRLLVYLSTKELKGFQEYLSAPYVNISNKTKCIQLLGHLIQKSKKKKNASGTTYLSFPDSVIKDIAQNRTLISYLTKALEGYIGTFYQLDQSIIQEDFQRQLRLLEFLQEKKLFNLFDQQYKSLLNASNKSEKSEKAYHNQMLLAQIKVNQLTASSNKRELINFENLISCTNRYHFLNALKLSCLYENSSVGRSLNGKQTIIGNHYLINFSEGITKFEDDELINLYYSVINAFQDEHNTIDSLNAILSQIKIHAHKIANEELNILLRSLENICLEKTRTQIAPQYRLLLIDIFQYLDDLGLLIVGNEISVRGFLNNVNEAAKTKNFEWGQKFIEKYSPQLPKLERQNIINIGNGILFYEMGDYQSCINSLDDYSVFESDPKLDNNRNTLLFKAFYENNQLDYLLPRIERRLEFFRTKKLKQDYITPSKAFLQILKKLAKLRSAIKRERMLEAQIQQKKENLIQAIDKANKVDNIPWLLQKIDELGK